MALSPSAALAAPMRTRTRSKGSLATLTAVAAGLAAVVAAFSTIYEVAFASTATLPAQLRAEAPPKRPVSGYILWTSSRRPALAKAMPDQKATELVKALGAEWQTLPDREKAEWNNKATILKDVYQQEVQAWTSLYGPIPQKEKTGKKAAAPRALTPYMLFVKAHAKSTMAELRTTKITDAAAELGRRWKQMTDAQKAPYAQEAALAKAGHPAAPPPERVAAEASPPKGKAKAKVEPAAAPETAKPAAAAPASKAAKPAAAAPASKTAKPAAAAPASKTAIPRAPKKA